MTATRTHFLGYPLRHRKITVAGSAIALIGPADCEALLSDPRVVARFEADQYMPYWAEFWPASLLLAEEVAAWGSAAGCETVPRVLELGCGLGLVSLVAARLGYPVVACDCNEDALSFVRENAKLNDIPTPATLCLDWRRSRPELCADRIVAAEVLYEERNLRPVAEFIRDHLSRNGFGLVCDPDRPTADGFEAVARSCGLRVRQWRAERIDPDESAAIRGRIFRLEHDPDA